jgi:hypothetical protein
VPAAFLEYRSEDAITTAPAPTNVTVLESVNSGSYMAGQPWTFRVYATHVIGGTTYYNSAYVEVGPVVIVGNNVAIDFTWDICGR